MTKEMNIFNSGSEQAVVSLFGVHRYVCPFCGEPEPYSEKELYDSIEKFY